MPKLKREYIRLLASLSSLGIEMAVSIIIGYFIGVNLDRFFNTGTTLTIIFILLGIAAGFKSLFMVSKRVQKDIDEHKLDNVYDKEDDEKDTL